MTRGASRNPRQVKARERRKAAARYAAQDAPCGICNGARGPIDYMAPRSHLYPLSLVIDEKVPVSRWRESGYPSADACACDPSNWQPAHWICNSQAGDKRKAREFRRDATSGSF
jgi:hypothetical protein